MWIMSDRGVELMRKYVKTFRFWEEDHKDIDQTVNSWIEEKHAQVGKTIARFEVLYVELTSTEDFVLVMVFYTEMKL